MIFTIVNIVLCSVIAILCFTSDRGKHTFYLGFIFCILCFQRTASLDATKPMLSHASVVWLPETLFLLVPPLLVHFVRSVSGFSNYLYAKYLLIPSGVYAKAFSYFYVVGYVKSESFHKSGLFYGGASVGILYNFVIAVWLLVWIHTYRQSIRHSSFYWLQGLLLFIIVYAMSGAATLGAAYLNRVLSVQWLIDGAMVVFFAALLINGLKILTTPIQISVKEEKMWEASVADMPLQVPTKKELCPKLREEYAHRIREALEVKKNYLNPKVTLSHLAKNIDMSPHDLSYVVNNEWELNFNELINSYRVNEAKKLLQDEKYDTATMFAIAIDSGFNSESSFYTVFKKATGKSPKRYRDALKSVSQL